jgi:hypothetical protein
MHGGGTRAHSKYVDREDVPNFCHAVRHAICLFHLSGQEQNFTIVAAAGLMVRNAATDETITRKIQRSRAALHALVSGRAVFHGRYREADRFHL